MGYQAIEIRQDEYPGVTFVPNEFIDRYMAKAPGEYVKVYLYLLRCLYDREASFSFDRAAQLLDSSEGDIRRALFFWESEELLSLECSGNTITGISLCTGDAFPRSSGESSGAPESAADTSAETVPDYSAARLKVFGADPEIGQVLFVAGQYLGHSLSHRELCYFYHWSKIFSFDPELIIELTDLCVSNGSGSMEEMHECALRWYEAGIKTSAAAREFMRLRRADAEKKAAEDALQKKVCSAFGITGRSLNDAECTRIRKWSQEWNFSDEMISEACRRTITNTHQASFEYADTVLRNWYRSHITDPEGVKAEDEAFHARKNPAKHTAAKSAAASGAVRRGKYGELELLTMANI